jgi:hypothetical protein
VFFVCEEIFSLAKMGTTDEITHSPVLKIEHATPDDLQAINDIWYTCFPEPLLRKIFPDTPGGQKWWRDANLSDMEKKPAANYLLVRDYSVEGGGKVAGYAKWFVPVGNERLVVEERFPPWHEESNKELCNVFFGTIGEERKKLMGDEQYYCEYFDLIFFQVRCQSILGVF